MGLARLHRLESQSNEPLLLLDAPVRPEARLALPRDDIEQAVIDLRRSWGLSLDEACVLLQAALGHTDRIIAFRLTRSRSSLRKLWQSIREKSGHDHHRRSVFDVWQRAMPRPSR